MEFTECSNNYKWLGLKENIQIGQTIESNYDRSPNIFRELIKRQIISKKTESHQQIPKYKLPLNQNFSRSLAYYIFTLMKKLYN